MTSRSCKLTDFVLSTEQLLLSTYVFPLHSKRVKDMFCIPFRCSRPVDDKQLLDEVKLQDTENYSDRGQCYLAK